MEGFHGSEAEDLPLGGLTAQCPLVYNFPYLTKIALPPSTGF